MNIDISRRAAYIGIIIMGGIISLFIHDPWPSYNSLWSIIGYKVFILKE